VHNGIIGGHGIFFDYQRMNTKKSTLKNYQFVLNKFKSYFGNIELSSITTEMILPFLMKISEGVKQSTKKFRYSLLSAFFTFIKTSFDSDLQNPCDSPALRKLFKEQRAIHWKIVSKIILRHSNLSTTQRYLGKVSDIEAMRWIDSIHG